MQNYPCHKFHSLQIEEGQKATLVEIHTETLLFGAIKSLATKFCQCLCFFGEKFFVFSRMAVWFQNKPLSEGEAGDSMLPITYAYWKLLNVALCICFHFIASKYKSPLFCCALLLFSGKWHQSLH